MKIVLNVSPSRIGSDVAYIERALALVDATACTVPKIVVSIEVFVEGLLREVSAMEMPVVVNRALVEDCAKVRIRHWMNVWFAAAGHWNLTCAIVDIRESGTLDELVKQSRIVLLLRDLTTYCDVGEAGDHIATLRDGTEVYMDIGEGGQSFLRMYDRAGEPLPRLDIFAPVKESRAWL